MKATWNGAVLAESDQAVVVEGSHDFSPDAMTLRKVDVLYFDGCPSWQQGVENLRAALSRLGLDWPVELVQVPDDQRATQLRFLGSPSFQVDGQDLWPEEREAYSLSCRVYVTPQGFRGWPTVEMLEERLRSV